jgi:ADP-heptose:LPS heptosyltransferase
MPKASAKALPEMSEVKRLLILRWGGVGDFLLTLPAVYSARRAFPRAHVAIMANPDTIALASTPEYGDEFLEFEWAIGGGPVASKEAARSRMTRKFREFDLIINYHSIGPVDGLLQECGVHSLTFDDAVFSGERRHASEHFRSFLRKISVPSIYSRPKVYLSQDERQFALNYLARLGIECGRDRAVAVHPGSGDPRKRWFPDRFRKVISAMTGRGAKILLFTGPEEEEFVKLVVEGIEPRNLSIVRDLPIRKVAAVIERATLFLGNDSGLMHLASSVGTPIVALFGPSDPVTWGPVGARNIVLIGNCSRTNLDVEVCRSCDFQECLHSIKADEVVRVVIDRLEYLWGSLSRTCLANHHAGFLQGTPS